MSKQKYSYLQLHLRYNDCLIFDLIGLKTNISIDRYNEKTTQLLVPYQYFGDPYPDLKLFLQKSHYSILDRLQH